jgi:Peptidase family M1 domain/Peptidase M1 N-terminal domain
MRRMVRAGLAAALTAGLGLASAGAQAADAARPHFSPGAPGIGDPYYPLDGNGGYDAEHYGLDLAYDPPTDRLMGTATIRAAATQNLSRFDLDFDGLTVRKITVAGKPASWKRTGQELVITPERGLRKGKDFTVVVTYDGVPQPVEDQLGVSGFLHTADGVIVAGQPHVAATWFPVNDHPADKASYTITITAPKGLDVTSNGTLTKTVRKGPVTRWTWDAKEPMASYLATLAIGNYDVTSYRADGLSVTDAIDSSLLAAFAAPRTGSQYALSQSADSSYKRLSHSVAVPAGGANLSFQLARDTEETWDYVFVEAHTAGADDWTTLPDANGHTSADVGNSCPTGNWLALHPFLTHYQTFVAPADPADPEVQASCTPAGSTGTWHAATGASAGYEQWSIDLSRFAGKTAEVSISYASDEIVQRSGLYVDDVTLSAGSGSTSFENDADTLDGWSVPGAPAGSPGNANDWVAGPESLAPQGVGEIAQASLKREPEIVRFLASTFGPYPFNALGGIVPNENRLSFALETQTRPVYSPAFFFSAQSGDSVVVHELAHQWFGDSLALKRWKDIWLNEGFATYAEWLWSEREGLGTAQELFDARAQIPADDPIWTVVIGDPGADRQFDNAVYERGAMTLHALRTLVGDTAFFSIIKTWAATKQGKNVTTPQFIALAEKISGQDLGGFFTTWLDTPAKPAGIDPAPSASRAAKRGGAPVVPGSRFGELVRRAG